MGVKRSYVLARSRDISRTFVKLGFCAESQVLIRELIG